MGRITIVAKRDYREIRHSAAFRVMAIIAAAVTVAAAAGISVALNLQSWLGQPQARPLLELFVGLVLYFLPLFVLIAFVWAFANLPVTKEKVNGNIEALMATPLTPHELWLGKSIAIYMPGYAIAALATMIVVLVMHLAAIIPAGYGFVLPVPALVLGLIINPLLFLGLLLFMISFSLVNNPDIALAPALILGFGLMMGMPAGLATGALDLNAWSFALWYLAGAVVILALVLYLSRMLTRQNIVLSSKGD
ncbi:MAG: hypothetical protein ACLFVA_02835 [Dehalococcoidia bacterium]